MATIVCDRAPCDYMRAAIEALVSYSYRSDRFSLIVQSQIDHRIFFLVQFKYCPFCGTRIDPLWVKSFYRAVDSESLVAAR